MYALCKVRRKHVSLVNRSYCLLRSVKIIIYCFKFIETIGQCFDTDYCYGLYSGMVIQCYGYTL